MFHVPSVQAKLKKNERGFVFNGRNRRRHREESLDPTDVIEIEGKLKQGEYNLAVISGQMDPSDDLRLSLIQKRLNDLTRFVTRWIGSEAVTRAPPVIHIVITMDPCYTTDSNAAIVISPSFFNKSAVKQKEILYRDIISLLYPGIQDKTTASRDAKGDFSKPEIAALRFWKFAKEQALESGKISQQQLDQYERLIKIFTTIKAVTLMIPPVAMLSLGSFIRTFILIYFRVRYQLPIGMAMLLNWLVPYLGFAIMIPGQVFNLIGDDPLSAKRLGRINKNFVKTIKSSSLSPDEKNRLIKKSYYIAHMIYQQAGAKQSVKIINGILSEESILKNLEQGVSMIMVDAPEVLEKRFSFAQTLWSDKHKKNLDLFIGAGIYFCKCLFCFR